MKQIIATSVALILVALATVAEVPRLIKYQGRLADSTGMAIDTIADLDFTLYKGPGGTTPMWTETHVGVIVEDGLFSVTLGTYSSIGDDLFDGSTRYLGVQIDGGPVSTPLIAIVSTAYSIHSAHADTAEFAHAAPGEANSGWTDEGSVVRLNNPDDSVGIGTGDPRFPLEVEGTVTAIVGHSLGNGMAIGVMGANDSAGIGVLGSSNSGTGVQGISFTGYGGYFFGPKHYFSNSLGIGTETPEEMLHVYRDNSGATSFLKLQSGHPSNWGQAGLRIQTPQNLWHLRMDDDVNLEVPAGGLGLRSQNAAKEVMTWTNDGQVGVNKTDPTFGLDVYAISDALRVHATGGFSGYFAGAKTYFGTNVGIGTDDPTHRLTLNGALALQSGGMTRFHVNCYNGGLNFSETSVADYRLNIETGGNVGIGTGDPQERLHVEGNARIDGTLMADAFEEDAINRHNIADEVGLVSAYSTDLTDVGTSWSSYLLKEINVPTAGYILVIGMAEIGLQHSVSGISQVLLGISDIPNDINGGLWSIRRMNSNFNAGTSYATIPCRRRFYVSSGGTYTYYMVAERHSDNSASIYVRHMDLIFIPTGYGTKNSNEEKQDDYANVTQRPADSRSDTRAIREPESYELRQLRSEVAALRQTMNELSARLSGNND